MEIPRNSIRRLMAHLCNPSNRVFPDDAEAWKWIGDPTAVRNLLTELTSIDPSMDGFGDLLGKGQFGVVRRFSKFAIKATFVGLEGPWPPSCARIVSDKLWPIIDPFRNGEKSKYTSPMSDLLVEWGLLSKTSSPHIATPLACLHVPGFTFLVMEVAIGDLHAVLHSKVKLPRLLCWDDIRTILFGALTGLIALHEAGIEHNDVAEPNILVYYDETTDTYHSKITDMSLSRPRDMRIDGEFQRQPYRCWELWDEEKTCEATFQQINGDAFAMMMVIWNVWHWAVQRKWKPLLVGQGVGIRIRYVRQIDDFMALNASHPVFAQFMRRHVPSSMCGAQTSSLTTIAADPFWTMDISKELCKPLKT